MPATDVPPDLAEPLTAIMAATVAYRRWLAAGPPGEAEARAALEIVRRCAERIAPLAAARLDGAREPAERT